MAEIKRDGEKVVVEMTSDELKDLMQVLESAGNSSARYHNQFPKGSLVRQMHLDRAVAAWEWANGLGSCPPDESGSFTTSI